MSRSSAFVTLTCALLLLSTATSCQRGPKAVGQPSIDASSAGKLAMEQYDKNGDGKVAGDELDKAPGLKAALSRLDADGDKAVTADEVTARVNAWKQSGVGLMMFRFRVALDGNPLAGANVTFEPESFLGTDIKGASCTLGDAGEGGASIAIQDRPTETTPPGMQLGLYKVKISKIVNGKEMIPAKYNESTILGQEVTQGVPEIIADRVVYVLTSK